MLPYLQVAKKWVLIQKLIICIQDTQMPNTIFYLSQIQVTRQTNLYSN